MVYPYCCSYAQRKCTLQYILHEHETPIGHKYGFRRQGLDAAFVGLKKTLNELSRRATETQPTFVLLTRFDSIHQGLNL